MVNMVDYLLEQGPHIDVAALEAPHNIFQMIERNVERLDSDQQRVLEAASVAGAEFSAAAVAAAFGSSVTEIEACCMRLSRREQFVAADGTVQWPDGTVASMFRFHHTFYSEVLYGRLAAGQRIELHRRIAEREETDWGERANEIAAELAHHYTQAREIEQAVRYWGTAASNALNRSANIEAIDQLHKAIELGL
jgi:predicted ATPase